MKIALVVTFDTAQVRTLEVPFDYTIQDVCDLLILGRKMMLDEPDEIGETTIEISLLGEILPMNLKLCSLNQNVISFGARFVQNNSSAFVLGNLARQIVQLTTGELPLARHRHAVTESQRKASSTVMSAFQRCTDFQLFSPSVDAMADEDFLGSSILNCVEYDRLVLSVGKILTLLRSTPTSDEETHVEQFREDIMSLCALVHNDTEILSESDVSLSTIFSDANETPSWVASRILLAILSPNSQLTTQKSETIFQDMSMAIRNRNRSQLASCVSNAIAHYIMLFGHKTAGLLPIPSTKIRLTPEMLRWTQCVRRIHH